MAAAATAAAAAPPDYLVALDLESSTLGSHNVNRSEIVEWPWVVYDMRARMVVDMKQIFVAPQWGPNPNPPPESFAGLHVDVAFAPSLKDAIEKFDTYLYRSFAVHGKTFCLLSDGHWDLRSHLLLECARKVVPLAPHFRKFFNLRSEFGRCYPSVPAPIDRRTMVNYLNIPAPAFAVSVESCKAMADIVHHMQNDDHAFVSPEVIPEFDWSATYHREPAVAVPIAAAVPVGGIVRLRGLPWTCTERDIYDFFRGIQIVPDGIHFVKNAHGKANGEAFVQLQNLESVHHAQQRHKRMMGRRYIEIFKSNPIDMLNHLGRADMRRQLHQQQMLHAQAHKAAAAAAANAAAAAAAANATASAGHGPRNQAMGSPSGTYTTYGPSVNVPIRAYPQKGQGRRGSMQHRSRSNALPIPHHHMHGIRGGGVPGSGTGKTFVLRVHGLPAKVSAMDVASLFEGLQTLGNGVHLVMAPDGVTCNGDAFVEFTSEAWGKKALLRSPIQYGEGTIVVSRSSFSELTTTLYGGESAMEASIVHGAYGNEEDARRPRPVSLPTYGDQVMPSVASAAAVIAAADERAADASLRVMSPGAATVSGALVGRANGAESLPGALGGGPTPEWVLRVSGLQASASRKDVGDMFREYGVRENGVYVWNSGESQSTAFVAVGSHDACNGAVEALNAKVSDKPPYGGGPLSVVCVSECGVAKGNDIGVRQVLRLSGLPEGCIEGELREFFSGLEVAEDGVVYGGGASAWVHLVSASQASFALQHLDGKPLRESSVRLGIV